MRALGTRGRGIRRRVLGIGTGYGPPPRGSGFGIPPWQPPPSGPMAAPLPAPGPRGTERPAKGATSIGFVGWAWAVAIAILFVFVEAVLLAETLAAWR